MTATYPKIKLEVGVGHGTVVWFEDTEITKAKIIREISPLSTEIPIGTLEFTIYSTSADYSIFSDGTYFDYLSKRQPIDVYESVDLVDRYLGRFFLDKWENPSEYELTFKAFDLVGVADASPWDGYYWDSATTMDDIVDAILTPQDIPFTVHVDLASDTFTGWIPPGTCREALQQICFAAGAMVIAADDDELQIVPTILPYDSPTADDTILDTERTGKQPVTLLPLITSIDVISHDYTEGTDVVTILSDTLAIGDYKFIFNDPYFDVTATGVGSLAYNIAAESGYQLITEGGVYLTMPGDFQYGSNCIYLYVLIEGAVVVTGYLWIDGKQSHVFDEADLDAYVTKNELAVKDASMVSSTIVAAVLTRISSYYRQRYSQDVILFPCEHKTGDCVIINSSYGKQILGLIERMEYDLCMGFLATTKIVGVQYTAP